MSERVDLARLLSFAADPKYKPGDDPLSDFTAVVMADAILAAGYVRLPVEGSPEEAATPAPVAVPAAPSGAQQVTDEMVEAALAEFIEQDWPRDQSDENAECLRSDMRAALEAAIAVRAIASVAQQLPLSKAGNRQAPCIPMRYTNYRGETAIRHIIPLRVWWGSTEWHPEPDWLLESVDVEKCATRDFALSDADFRTLSASPSPSSPANSAPPWTPPPRPLPASSPSGGSPMPDTSETPEDVIRFLAGDGDLSSDPRMANLAACIVMQQGAGFRSVVDLREEHCPDCGASGFNTGWGVWRFACGAEIHPDGEPATLCPMPAPTELTETAQ